MIVEIISILSRKGGVGKTLLSIGVAQVLGTSGFRVALLDRDPEGSATGWQHNARAAGIELPYQVVGPVEATRLGTMDYIVVDTPPNDVKVMNDTARQSQHLLIPLLPGASEIDRLQETVNSLFDAIVYAKPRVGFVVNRMERDNVSLATVPTLEKMGYPVIAQMRKAVDYQRAFGDLIPEALTQPFRDALVELGVLK